MWRVPVISRRFCTRCGPSALAFVILPKCPVCISVALLAVGIPIAIPHDLFTVFRGALVLYPIAFCLIAAGRYMSALVRVFAATLLLNGILLAASSLFTPLQTRTDIRDYPQYLEHIR